MKDSQFKSLQHRVGGHRVSSCGGEVAKGYKPDLVVTDTNGKPVFIVECEQKTDRKAFLGTVVKAEKYAKDCQARPVLVIVMQLFPNTTVKQIADHLSLYAAWLAQLEGGALRLSDILVISDEQYCQSVQANEVIASEQFRVRATRITYVLP